MMFVSFHSKRTTPSSNDKLNTLVSGILICSNVSISSFGLILEYCDLPKHCIRVLVLNARAQKAFET